jgi:hypothetical protein
VKRLLAVVIPLIIVAGASAAGADTVIVPSQHVEVGPVSTDTPEVTRNHEDESFQESLERCLADPQLSPTAIGCPE